MSLTNLVKVKVALKTFMSQRVKILYGISVSESKFYTMTYFNIVYSVLLLR